jgi:hypothetical protein
VARLPDGQGNERQRGRSHGEGRSKQRPALSQVRLDESGVDASAPGAYGRQAIARNGVASGLARARQNGDGRN